MRIRFSPAILCCIALAPLIAAAQQPPTLKSHRIAGDSYVAVSDVASFYGLGRNQSRSSDRAEYRTSFAQLALQPERREITLDGVQHWLSSPVLAARGQLWLAPNDVLKVLDPVLRQGRGFKAGAIRTIIIDPGHGGSDRGTRGASSFEKAMTLDVAKRIARSLTDDTFRVMLTRTTDRTLSLEDRVDLAEKQRADLFVSVHFNSGGSASGIETYCVPPAGEASTATSGRSRDSGEKTPNNRYDELNVWLAHCVQSSLLRATGAGDRGVRRARFYVLRNATCPAILVEAGFLSNRDEERRILSAEYREQLAKAIATGILAYKKAVE